MQDQNDNTQLAKLLALCDLKEALVLAQLNAELRTLTDKDIPDLVAVYTPHEVADALRVVELIREYGCDYDEIDAALRLRKRQNEHHSRYHRNHKEEANLKNATRMRQKRSQMKAGTEAPREEAVT